MRAPITGTIIEIDVARGQVIASATSNVGGGTTLLKMADLTWSRSPPRWTKPTSARFSRARRRPSRCRPFPTARSPARVLKIEPKDTVQQNVTMFPVRVRIDNRNGLLRPGMNADVEIHVGQRAGVRPSPMPRCGRCGTSPPRRRCSGWTRNRSRRRCKQQQQQQRPPDGRADSAGAPAVGSRADTASGGTGDRRVAQARRRETRRDAGAEAAAAERQRGIPPADGTSSSCSGTISRSRLGANRAHRPRLQRGRRGPAGTAIRSTSCPARAWCSRSSSSSSGSPT